MSHKLKLTALMALMVALPSWASDLPTSENPAKVKWNDMNPASFSVDMVSVLEQCNRAASVSNTDRLTTAMCQKLPTLIQGKKCVIEQVPDGIVFDYMNGRKNGRSSVTRNTEKALGRTDPALICDLGNRTFAYWFTGVKGQSCNNIGIVFTALPVVPVPSPSPPVLVPPPPPKVMEVPPVPPAPISKAEVPAPKCGWVSQRYIIPQAGQFIHVPGLSVAVCRGQVAIPDTFVNIPGDVMTVTRQVEVCR